MPAAIGLYVYTRFVPKGACTFEGARLDLKNARSGSMICQVLLTGQRLLAASAFFLLILTAHLQYIICIYMLDSPRPAR